MPIKSDCVAASTSGRNLIIIGMNMNKSSDKIREKIFIGLADSFRVGEIGTVNHAKKKIVTFYLFLLKIN